MQGPSLAVTAFFVLLGALAVAFAAVIAAPAVIFAAIVFAIFFGIFLLRRGARRAQDQRTPLAGQSRVPTTAEASADPVADSPISDVARRPQRQ